MLQSEWSRVAFLVPAQDSAQVKSIELQADSAKREPARRKRTQYLAKLNCNLDFITLILSLFI